MSDILVRAPANVKISGEHSVIYGGPSLSAAVSIYATAKVEDTKKSELEVNLTDLRLSTSFDSATLKKLYNAYLPRDTSKPEDLVKYIKSNESIGSHFLPYATIAARLFCEHNVNVLGKKVTILSDVPIQKGYASSAVCATAFTMALLKADGKVLDDQTAIDIARDGDRIIHKAETAGRMDVGPAYYGGYAIFSSSEGIKPANISNTINLVVIDTGTKPPTAEMVKRVRDLYNADTAGTSKILKEIDACVLKCIDSLRNGDIKELGRSMSRNHELLKKLGVSSDKLDEAVSISISNGAYGAKLCGGGGGGMDVALVGGSSDAEKVISSLKNKGFDAYSVNISMKGAK